MSTKWGDFQHFLKRPTLNAPQHIGSSALTTFSTLFMYEGLQLSNLAKNGDYILQWLFLQLVIQVEKGVRRCGHMRPENKARASFFV
jgi:hypothetical protein